MAQKNNIRSIRFSDELAELINQQVGDTFTQKFENLVTRCVWELPQKEKELARLDQAIKDRQNQLEAINSHMARLLRTIHTLEPKMQDLENAIKKEVKSWQPKA